VVNLSINQHFPLQRAFLLYLLFSGGLQPGDIVTHINKKEIKNSSDVYDALADNSKTLDIVILRGVKQMHVTITPEDP